MKTAFAFSGQGSQYVGMGEDFYQKFDEVRDIYHQANEILGYSITDLSFKNNDLLHETRYTQPAIFTMSMAIHKILEARNIKPDYVLGLSLGEYSALVSSGTIPFSEGLSLVNKRSRIMTAVVGPNSGKMVAVLNTPKTVIEAALKQVNGLASIANYNTPKQLVVGGEATAIDQLVEILKEQNVKRIVPLNVSGPFHTAIYRTAAAQLYPILKDVDWQDFKCPLITNVTGKVLEKENLAENLAKQVMSPVKFYQSIEELKRLGVERIIEIGPGKVLSSFVKKIDKEIETYNIEKVEDLDFLLEKWKG